MARHRAQFFLDDHQYEEIERLAATQQRPILELVHDLVDLGLENLKERPERSQQRMHVLQELKAQRQTLEARQGTYPGDLVAEARTERERERNAVLPKDS